MGRRELALISVAVGPSAVLVGLIIVALVVTDLQRFAPHLTSMALFSAIAFPALANVLRMRSSSRSEIASSRCG